MTERHREIRRRRHRKRKAKLEDRAFVLANGTGLRKVFHPKGDCLSLRMRGKKTTIRSKTRDWCTEQGLRPCGRCSEKETA